MAARSGVPVPVRVALAAAAAGGRIPPSASRTSRAASAVMAARRAAPARSHRSQVLLLEMLVFMVVSFAVALTSMASVVATGLVGAGALPPLAFRSQRTSHALDDRHRGQPRRRPAGHSSASPARRTHPTTVTLGMTVLGRHRHAAALATARRLRVSEG